QSPTRRARMRLGLLVLAAVALALWLNQFRNPGWDLPEPARTPAAAPAFDPTLQPIAVDADAIHRIPTPPALAATLAAMELATVPAATLCLSLDGEEADTAALAVARAAGLDPQPSAACAGPGPWLRVAVDDYRTDGSGTGTVAPTTTPANSRGRHSPPAPALGGPAQGGGMAGGARPLGGRVPAPGPSRQQANVASRHVYRRHRPADQT